MEKLDIPPIPEFVEMIADSGAGIYACKASVDMFGLSEEDFVPQVEEMHHRRRVLRAWPPAARSSSPSSKRHQRAGLRARSPCQGRATLRTRRRELVRAHAAKGQGRPPPGGWPCASLIAAAARSRNAIASSPDARAVVPTDAPRYRCVSADGRRMPIRCCSSSQARTTASSSPRSDSRRRTRRRPTRAAARRARPAGAFPGSPPRPGG